MNNSIAVKKIKSNKDNIYYNAVMFPDPSVGGNSTVATYSENLTQALVQNPSEYYCSIIRFQLPIDTIPILLFPVDDTQNNPLQSYLALGINLGGTYPTTTSSTNSVVPIGGTNYGSYTVGGITYPGCPVMYIPESNGPPPSTVAVTAPFFTNTQIISSFYWVYSIQQMIDMFNNTLNTAMITAGMPLLYTLTLSAPANATIGDIYVDSVGERYVVNATIVASLTLVLVDTFNSGPILPTITGTLTKISGLGDATITYSLFTTSGITRPYYTYSPTSNLISLHVADDFLSTGAKIFMNRWMVNFLASFKLYFDIASGNDLLHYHDLRNLPEGQVSPYTITQDYNTISLWFSLRKILLLSNTLPIVPEAIPTGQTNGVVSYYPVVTDFAVALDNANQLQELLVYNPSSQYRLVNMVGNSPLNKIDFSFFWEDKYGNILPVPLSAYQSASVKIGFFKKSLYNNDESEW